ncbi:DUF5663 domain-containing protein [Micromonospora sp. NPDC048909]|uniref:DUF5663 domain-containing protein n=1 Tax=Micromonospora sp. NPDC048909 TaxID=3155643 RepID=UPI00340BE586
MKISLDDHWLAGIGLDELPKAHRRLLLQGVYEELELRVGMALAEQMSQQQLDEFEVLIDRGDESGALEWLAANCPDHPRVVTQEHERLRAEIAAQAPDIVAMAGLWAPYR